MKKLVLQTLVLLLFAYSSDISSASEEPNYDFNLTSFKAEVAVVDSETGEHCQDAIITMECFGNKNIDEKSNAQGKVVFGPVMTGGGIVFYIEKEGYYNFKLDLNAEYASVINKLRSELQQKGMMQYTVHLRPIKNPMTMNTNTVIGNMSGLLWNEERYGYDFEVGDWIHPWGYGKRADMYFQIKGSDEYEKAELIVDFPSPHDGVLPIKEGDVLGKDYLSGSAYRYPYEAPETGYLNRWTLQKEKRKYATGKEPFYRFTYYIFRIRTDEKGNGGCYGIITEGFDFTKGIRKTTNEDNAKLVSVKARYYYNPSGMRNLEPAMDGSDFNPQRTYEQNLNGDWKNNKYYNESSIGLREKRWKASRARNEAAAKDEKIFKAMQAEAARTQKELLEKERAGDGKAILP